jgi:hypothetical protein
VAIVKASYTDSVSKIKKTVKYIQHRAGRDGERMTRTLFGVDGVLTREEVYQLIDEAPEGAYFYHLKISPDPRREDSDRSLSLREITDNALFALSQKLHYHVEYAGAIHDDHTPIRHVHVIAMTWGKLDRSDLKVLRESATEAALLQRRERDGERRSISRDGRRSISQSKEKVAAPLREEKVVAPLRGKRVVPPLREGRRRTGRGHRYKPPKRCVFCGQENCKEHNVDIDLQLEQEL